MAEIVLDGPSMNAPEDFYAQFFGAAQGLMPDYGGRNLDALDDDLSERHSNRATSSSSEPRPPALPTSASTSDKAT